MQLIVRAMVVLAAGLVTGTLLAFAVAFAYASPAGATPLDRADSINIRLDADGGSWIAAGGSLHHVAIGEEQAPSLDLRGAGIGDPRLIAVDAYDGSAWVVTSRDLLVHVDKNAEASQIVMLPTPVGAVAVDLDQSVWVAASNRLVRYNRHGDLDVIYSMNAPEPVDDLFIDSLRGRVVTRTGSTIAIFDVNGDRMELVDSIAFDQASIVSMRYDQIAGRAWLATRDEEVGLSLISSVSRSIEHGPLRSEPVIPLRLLPSIELDADSLALPPTLRLRVNALCNDVACDAGDDYYRSIRLHATIDDRPLPIDVRIASERVAEIASVPASGVLAVMAIDRFGHASEFVATALDGVQSYNGLKANQAPAISITTPVNNSTFATGSNVVLAANASDTDGTIVRVDFYRGSTLIGSSIKAPFTTTWTSVPAGNYTLTAKATDDKNASKTSANVNIVVKTPPNTAPSLTISSPAAGSVVNGPSVVISTTAVDTDGAVAKVEFFEGTKLLGTIAGGTASLTAKWTYSDIAPGSHTVKATATDSLGATTSASTTFTVNAAPWVVLTSPLPCTELISPVDVSLSADAIDTDGSVARVEFYAGTQLIGSSASAPYKVSWIGAPPGMYSMSAAAIDTLGATRRSNPVSLTIQATDVAPTAVLTSPRNGERFGIGTTLTLVGSANDSDGSVKRVDFLVGGSVVGSATAPPYVFNWIAATAGNFVLAIKATDNRGVATTSAPVNVSIASNSPPSVTLGMPAGGPVFAGPTTLSLVATANDTDGVVRKVEFFQGRDYGAIPSTPIGTATSAPFSTPFVLSNPDEVVVLMARATDDLGGHTDSPYVRVWINRAPTVQIGSPLAGSTILPGSTPRVILLASDFEEQTLRADVFAYGNGQLSWSHHTYLAGGSGQFILPTLSGLPAGTDIGIYATVTDPMGSKTTSAPVFVKTPPSPVIKMLTPACNTTILTPATIQFTASASQSVGKIVRVEYYDGRDLIGSATTPPYALTWTPQFNPDSPKRSITAQAVDNLGTGGVNIDWCYVFIDVVKLDIDYPSENDDLYGAQTVVRGSYQGETPSRIVVNDVPATFANGTFSARIPTPGSVRVVATTSRGTTYREITVHPHRPLVVLLKPVLFAGFAWGEAVELEALVEGYGPNLNRVEFWADDTRIGVATMAPYTAQWIADKVGSPEVRAVGIANDGTSTTSPPAKIGLGSPPKLEIQSPTSPYSMTTADSLRLHVYAQTIGTARLASIELLVDGDSIGALPLDGTREWITWDVTIPFLLSGGYDFRARFKDTVGRVAVSEPLHVDVADGPSISLVSPIDGAQFKSPAQIDLTATAETSRVDGLRVDFLANGLLIGSATTAPFTVRWSDVPDGSYQVVARATDGAGRSAATATSAIIVGRVALNISSHLKGQVVYDPAVVVAGTVTGNATNTTVFVNGVAATIGDGIWAATVPLVEGANVIQVVANVAGVSVSRSLDLTRKQPSISFANIRDGMTVDDDSVVVRGTLSAPPNSGLLIGGRVADVAPDGTFSATDVAIRAGTNPLTVKLIRQDGTIIDWTLGAITRARAQPFVVSLRPPLATEVPFVAMLTVDKRSTVDYSELQVVQGERRLFVNQVSSMESSTVYSLTFAQYGTSVFTVRLLNSTGDVVFSRELVARVARREESADRIRELFSSFGARILAGDIAGGTSAFHPAQQSFYQTVFASLATSDRLRAVAEMQKVGMIRHGPDHGQLMLTIGSQDGNSGFPVNAIRDGTGIWRLSGL